jgi:hypothetical protein
MLAGCRLLSRDKASLLLGLLDLLEHHGTGEAFQPVQDLARRTQCNRVKQRAEALAPILEERLRQAKSVAFLLRPSAAGSSPDMLLRAGEASGTAPAELLRATDGDAPSGS